MISDIFELFQNGEPIPYVIFAMVCVGFIIIFEKFFLLQIIYRINFEKFNSQIKKMLLANDLERARNLCRSISKTGIPMLAIKVIDAYESEPFSVRATVSEQGLRFFPRIRRRLAHLPNFSVACVILGALEAVHGVWHSFGMVNGLESSLKTYVFSKSLTSALLPMSLSLAAALILMFPYGILDAIASRLELEMEQSIAVILNVLSPEKIPLNTRIINESSCEKQSKNTDAVKQVVKEEKGKEESKQNEPEINPSQLIPDEEEII